MSNTTKNNCSNLDDVVVPWISLHNGNNSTANNQNASAASTSDAISSHQNLATAKEGRSCKILSLLSARERVGARNQLCGGRVGWLYNGSYDGVVVTADGLAHSGAWNPRRLQNMTLAIGPGTPASCVLPTETHSSSLSASSSSSDDEMFQDLDEERLSDNEEDADHGSDNQLHDDNDSEENENDGDTEVLPSDAEEGQEYHFDDSGRLVRDSNDSSNDRQEDGGVATPREEAEAEIARHLSARITQSPGDQDDDEDEDDRPSPCFGGNTGRRGHWEKQQQSILNALNGVGNEEDDHDDSIEGNGGAYDERMESHNSNNGNSSANENSIGNSSRDEDGSADSRDSAALRARDRYNIRRVEEYIDHLESLARRRERRDDDLLSSPAREQGVYNDSTHMFEREVARSMKHGGCINTVSWLDCGWRISQVSHEDASPFRRYLNDDEGFISSSASYSANNPQTSPYVTPPRSKSRRGLVKAMYPNEYPTQLVTSGDDHLVKFWDVAASMGSISPLPGGSATITPFSSAKMPMRACSELVDTWKASSTTIGTHKRYLPGIVYPLVTLPTQHRGNVFHVTPVPHSLGKVATCAADGYLRLLDVEVHSTSAGRNRSNSTTSASSNTGDSSSIIISPEYQSEENGEESLFRFHNSSMCFSHHFLNANVGLVCSESGLLHFDLRLPARSQKRGSLVPELSSTCKSCHPWRLGSSEGGENNLESAYVFAGGTKNHVGLYDLRMTGSSSTLGNDNQVIQRYRPRALKCKSSVAVSGIDLSKDKRELLVSYESDQVYTFPIFGGKNPTLSDIENCNSKQNKYVAELAAYGGHLNRLTFLKSAKYAGPNDEYICTGSDSGHAFIYEKKSGTVVSFIKADNSTCNGIQPHPTLPYFITYGIDSTAKLFRATTPVDINVDDSDLGRYNYSKQVKYEKSMVADEGKKALKGKEVDLDDENLSLFPDEASEDNNDDPDHFLGVFIRSRFSENAPFIGNDMMELSKVLAKNYFTCAKCIGIEEDEPVRSGIASLKQRVSLIKMRNQADRLGLDFDHETPWILKPKEHIKKLIAEDGSSGNSMISYGCLADLIPDSPSDWIPFEKLLANPPQPSLKYHLPESSADSSINPIWRSFPPVKIGEKIENEDNFAKLDQEALGQPFRIQANEKLVDSCEKQEYNPTQAWDILFQTISLLKEAGNEALKASLILLAAKRYDKAINYCAVAYLPFPVGTVDFLAEHQYTLSKNGGYECRWNPMLKTLIMLRLNLAMVNLKPEINDPKGSVAQSKLALNELKPFSTERGVVLTGKKLSKKRQDEPHTTYTEAKALEAKAYFRLGSAQVAMNDFDEAVKTFEHCVKSTKESGLTVDAGVLRKMREAKRCLLEQKGREKKKFKFMFSTKNVDD